MLLRHGFSLLYDYSWERKRESSHSQRLCQLNEQKIWPKDEDHQIKQWTCLKEDSLITMQESNWIQAVGL